MLPLNEELLSAWLKISTSIINSRVACEFPYNESLICNALYLNSLEENSQPLTATDLCHRTNMLKSQMNRTLNFLEEREIITRKRSDNDKRQVYIHFNPEKSEIYTTQHNKILKQIDTIISQMGETKTNEFIETLNYVANLADTVFTDD